MRPSPLELEAMVRYNRGKALDLEVRCILRSSIRTPWGKGLPEKYTLRLSPISSQVNYATRLLMSVDTP